MEVNEGAVRQDSEGVGSTGAGTENLPGTGHLQFSPEYQIEPPQVGDNSVQEPAGAGEARAEVLGTEGQQQQPLVPTIPPELQPDKDGNPPKITPELIRQLRGKYFTVKHVRLTDCGHLLDMVNQPKNNCETCWFNWFNSHAQLVETADKFYRELGKKPMVAMRGEKFVKNFLRFMATVHHFMQLEKEQKANGNNQERPITSGIAPAEARGESTVDSADEGREVEGGGISN